MPQSKSDADFVVRVAARFLKDPAISSDAKALRVVLGAFADGRTGASYVLPSTLEQTLGWSRYRRERAQRELVRCGWLRLGWKRGLRARWARRVYFCLDDRCSNPPQRRI
jgi:hypothetical protein